MAPRLLDTAIAHHRAGRLADAAAIYQDILSADAHHPDALHLLGVLLTQAGQADAGAALIAQAVLLLPGNADFHANHARALAALGQDEHAVTAARAAADLHAAHLPLLLELAARAGDVEMVLTACAALAANALQSGDRDAAIRWYRQTLAIIPDDPLALSNLGELLRQEGDYTAALPLLRQVADSRPNAPLPRCALARTLMELNRFDEARPLLEEVVRHHPAFLSGHRDLGQLRRLSGDTAGALRSYEAALALDPEDIACNLGRALCLLRLGRYAEGFAAYDWRWRTDTHPPRHTDLPRWTGGDAQDVPLLVWHEQGVGDTLQCLRFLPPLITAGARVAVEVPAPLLPLLSGQAAFAGARLQTPSQTQRDRDEGRQPADLRQIPFMDLAALACPDMAAIPWRGPYLHPDPIRRAHWLDWLGPRAGLRVGLFWQGNPAFPEDRWRSPGLLPLLPLLRVPGVSFVSLQLGADAELAAAGGTGMRNAGAKVRDWADTAALMSCLDLVIGSDTACLHLAGNLGVPAWLILSTTTDWRWHDDRTDSPWYPDVRIFRQPVLGDWATPVTQAMAALAERAAARE